jgi:plasmid stabilization system protein ParE
MRGFRLHLLADEDLEEAASFYERQRQGLGSRFLVEFERLIERLLSHPESAARVSRHLRMARVGTFPYNVLYRIEDDHIFVLAVFHQRRRPGFGRDRR